MFRTRSFAAGLSFLAGCAMLTTLFVTRELLAQDKVGYVLDLHGCWVPGADSGCLNRGNQVVGGALLRNTAAKASDGDSIVIADLRGEIIKRIRCKSTVCKECRSSGACYDPIQPFPKFSPPSGVLKAGFEGLMGLFSTQPDRFSVHRVRGESPADMVARISEDRISLGQIFEGVNSGPYSAIFTQIATNGDSPKWKSEPVAVDRQQTDGSQTEVRGLHPG
jgi:hypothetical protein